MVGQPMQRMPLDGGELEFVVVGPAAGDPVLFVHGAFVAEAEAPLCAEPALAGYRLVRYHRRGHAGSSRLPAGFGHAQQAADCRGLLRGLGIGRAHVVGHSAGGSIALRLALDAPEVVHSLALLEPTLMDVPSGPLFAEATGPARRLYEAGDKEGATDGFLRAALGPAYRSLLDERVPGGFAHVVANADAHFAATPTPSGPWRFSRADAGRIGQPVLAVLGGESAKDWVGWPEVHARVQEWLPQAEPFVLPGANHALHMMDPRRMAEALAAFFARHPMEARSAPSRPA
jgi:pimeloyl-ACP methyl ester carboxylesterase